jgi:hypothetical protein
MRRTEKNDSLYAVNDVLEGYSFMAGVLSKTAKCFGTWWSYINGDEKTLSEALNHVTVSLVELIKNYGEPDDLEWIVKTEDGMLDVAGPLGYRPNYEYFPDHDASVGWKAHYKLATPGAR